MTQMNRTLRGTARFLLLPLLAMLAASGCGESSSPGATGDTDNTGGTGPGTGGGAASSTTAGTGGGAASSTTAGTGGDAASSTTAGTGGGATSSTTAGTGSDSSGAGTGGAPNSRPTFHIFMLMGQSNMAGVAAKQASDQNSDQRLKVLGGCNQPAGQWNLANPPLSDCPGESRINLSTSVDPGIWFGKTLLGKLREGDTIGLIGTAESGESINTFISGGSHHQTILNKIAKAKTAENARFAGIIFHQGETDTGQSSWPGKVVQLYNEMKAAWGVDYDVPFILGELPAGGCCSVHNNLVHQAADMLPDGYWISQEGTKVMDQYHFDHASVVLMGTRYGEKMIEALKW
ncbi:MULTISPECIES: sialate O-acetylesterase [Sorangium]|uniref:Sialate O-acetylesterase domain-containing protein n=1 Tax=Sorangium cellulosum (strain So ce56) TaxID=448385 RepID=A9GHE3_SORC5|nr:sialate O-acetylesterase [Sorangium cellulosum]CAN99484.1 hypothetical protein predicted by Glimmer/Critica [Sorangium cellulosum So ce56]